MQWGEEQKKAFQELKDMLTKGPALGLPNLMLPFTLYIIERGGTAKGVLAQQIGHSMRPCAYLSKRLDAVARGFPPCLRVVAAAAMLLQDAKKLSFGAKTIIVTEHSIRSLLKEGTIKWMTGSRLMRHQLALLEDPEIELQVATRLNPASYLPDADTEERETHDCQTLLQQTWAVRADLQTVPLKNADLQWFTDGSSFVEDGVRKAGYAVVSLVDTIEAQPLPTGTSAQLAELIAVTRACEIAENQTLNLYSDSKYVHNMAHAYAALHHERGMLDSKGNPVKYQQQIQKFMDAVQKPKKLAFMHCRGHQKGGG
nr:Bel/Pao family RNase HI [Nuttalliella namaqua]